MLRIGHQEPILVARAPPGERTDGGNKLMLLKIIKTKLDDAKGTWPEELPNVLWAYRTAARTPIGETPFRLTYGIEAVIFVEVGVTNTRRTLFSKEGNEEKL